MRANVEIVNPSASNVETRINTKAPATALDRAGGSRPTNPFSARTDTFGIRNRHDVGVERILWSSDYPHISADWPSSWRVIQSSMSGVPADERHAILAGNAARLYRLT